MKTIKELKLRQFIWSIFLLVVGFILFLIGYSKWALLLIIFGSMGILIEMVGLTRKIKKDIYSKEWTNYTILMLILGLVFWTIAFEYKWTLVDIILCGIVLIAFYLLFRLVPWLIKKGEVSWF